VCPILGTILSIGLVSGSGFAMQSAGVVMGSVAVLSLAGVAGLTAALVGSMCAFRMHRYRNIVEQQNHWRPGDPHPLAITDQDSARQQAAAVDATFAELREQGRIRNRRMVARVSSATANRINNALTVVLGSLEIAEHRGFGGKYGREVQGIRDGVDDIREVCTRLLELSTHGGRQVRRVELGSHLRNLEPMFQSTISSRMNTFILDIEDSPIRVQVSPKRLTDWLCRTLEAIQRQTRKKTNIRMIVSHEESNLSLPIIEIQVRQKHPLDRVLMLEHGANGLGGKMERVSDANGRQSYRLRLASQEFEQVPESLEIADEDDLATASNNVLLVEDDEQVRRLLNWMLERRGNTIVEMADGEDAWTFMEEQGDSVRIAIIDLVIPGIDGVELAQRIRDRYSDVGILLVTGHDGEEGQEFIRNDPKASLLRKPFGEVDLEEAVASIDQSMGRLISGVC